MYLCLGLIVLSQASVSFVDLIREAQSYEVSAFMTSCRHHLHQIPELMFEEHNTSAFIRQQLDLMAIPYDYPRAKTGITAYIGRMDGPVIALRADMDGLPIEEPENAVNGNQGDDTAEDIGNDEPHGIIPQSRNAGKMHACGHDAHMSMLLGAAKLLKAKESKLPGKVVLLFQPAEEGGGGARFMIEEGALQGVQAVSGIHVWPSLPSGTVSTRAGVIMAASDRFSFVVQGKGGHGAMPHLAADPVVAASAIVLALQSLVSRETSPTDGAVVTVSRLNTGPGASNVIPEEVEVKGTVRALTQVTFERLHTRLKEVAKGVASSYGCVVEMIQWSTTPYPPTVNHPELAIMVMELATTAEVAFDQEGAGNVVHALSLEEPSMAAEDFSFYGQMVPSVFTFLGIGNHELGTDASLHNPNFRMDDSQMPVGAALHAATAIQFLSSAAELLQKKRVKKDEL
jgi:IAA-amino acid hydrolase